MARLQPYIHFSMAMEESQLSRPGSSMRPCQAGNAFDKHCLPRFNDHVRTESHTSSCEQITSEAERHVMHGTQQETDSVSVVETRRTNVLT